MISTNLPENFESSYQSPVDETDLALRHYVSNLSDEKVRAYRLTWTDEEVVNWCGDFRSDGALMLVCCERDVDVPALRAVVEEYIEYRGFLS